MMRGLLWWFVFVLIAAPADAQWPRDDSEHLRSKKERAPMGLCVWKNNTLDGNWGTAANWSGAAVPVANDEVVFDGSCVTSVILGLDQSAIDLDLLHVMPEYTGNIGMQGTPLQINADAFYYEGRGTLYHAYTGAFRTNLMIINSDNPSLAVQSGGEVQELILLKGHVELTGAYGGEGYINYILVAYRDNPAEDVYLVNHANRAAVVFIMHQTAGTVIADQECSNVYMAGGVYKRLSAGSTTATTWYETHGGHVEHNSGNITTLLQMGGTFDMSQDARAKTITVAKIFPGAEFIPNANTTITSGGNVDPLPGINP